MFSHSVSSTFCVVFTGFYWILLDLTFYPSSKTGLPLLDDLGEKKGSVLPNRLGLQTKGESFSKRSPYFHHLHYHFFISSVSVNQFFYKIFTKSYPSPPPPPKQRWSTTARRPGPHEIPTLSEPSQGEKKMILPIRLGFDMKSLLKEDRGLTLIASMEAGRVRPTSVHTRSNSALAWFLSLFR